LPKFVVGLDMEEFAILADYFSTLEPATDMENSIIYGIIAQLVSDFEDREPEFYYE